MIAEWVRELLNNEPTLSDFIDQTDFQTFAPLNAVIASVAKDYFLFAMSNLRAK
jgi:hypothetical protein